LEGKRIAEHILLFNLSRRLVGENSIAIGTTVFVAIEFYQHLLTFVDLPYYVTSDPHLETSNLWLVAEYLLEH
jgi:hypothetical protein